MSARCTGVLPAQEPRETRLTRQVCGKKTVTNTVLQTGVNAGPNIGFAEKRRERLSMNIESPTAHHQKTRD